MKRGMGNNTESHCFNRTYNSQYVLLPTLLLGIMECEVVLVHKLFRLICLSRNITITIHQPKVLHPHKDQL